MSQYNWGWWFVLSTFWVIAHVIIAMIDNSGKLVTHWFYMFGMILSLANLLFCIYIGNHPDNHIKD